MSKPRIVYISALAGWYIVRGPHWAPIGGRFPSKADAEAYLERRKFSGVFNLKGERVDLEAWINRKIGEGC